MWRGRLCKIKFHQDLSARYKCKDFLIGFLLSSVNFNELKKSASISNMTPYYLNINYFHSYKN